MKPFVHSITVFRSSFLLALFFSKIVAETTAGGETNLRFEESSKNNIFTRDFRTAHNISEGSRIVGGDKSEPGEFPYFVKIASCAGSLIAPNVVLTAAHCNPAQMVGNKAIVGPTKRKDSNNGPKHPAAEEITVIAGISHPDHEIGGFHNNDFGLVLLEKSYSMNSDIQLLLNEDPSYPPNGEMLHVIGMGATSKGGPQASELRDALVPAMSQQQCMNYYHLSDAKMCAGEKDGPTDACQGDSGGPLLKKRSNNVHIQVGIVSYGAGCAKYPGVYSRISNQIDWIRNQVCDTWKVSSSSLCPGNNSDDEKSSSSDGEPVIAPTPTPDNEEVNPTPNRCAGIRDIRRFKRNNQNCKKYVRGSKGMKRKKCNAIHRGRSIKGYWCHKTCSKRILGVNRCYTRDSQKKNRNDAASGVPHARS